jgi:hypothetical protein
MNELKLISGEFSPEEAKEVLMNIFADKIRFHDKKIISSLVRGIPDNTSEERINDLRENIKQLLDIIELANKEGKSLKIKSTINIELT